MKKNLAEIREGEKKTQQEMADLLGIAVSTYCQYETGKRNLPAEIVNRISKILNIDINDIFLPTRFTVSK